MTFRYILSAMLRRWFIPLALIGCATFATLMLAGDGGIFTTTTVVSFLRPATTSLSETNGANDTSVIAFAGTVVQATNNGRRPARYSMDEAPLYGAGVREGVLVQLLNSGNQWVSTFNRSDIEIQIVGRTYNWVESKQRELVNKVVTIANTRQAAVMVSSKDRIAASVIPLTLQIEHVTPSRSSEVAAGGAMLFVAIIVSAWGATTADRLASRRPTTARQKAKRLSRRVRGVVPS